jgi:hypothetical protein
MHSQDVLSSGPIPRHPYLPQNEITVVADKVFHYF